MYRNLIDTTLMAAAFKRRFQKHFDEFQRSIRRNKPGWQYQTVGIVVTACETGQFGIPAYCGTHSLVLV